MNPKKILLVDDNPAMIQVLAKALSGVGQLLFATNGEAALRLARQGLPDLILLDAEMPGLSGYEVCEALKADPALADVPVIFVTGHSEQAFELRGLEAGAADFLAKPISEPLLLARVNTQLRMKDLTDQLKRIASVDALTEVLNRRSFDAALDREWKRGLRSGKPLSLLMVDVDHFKRFNDHYGHPAGDACLRSVAQALTLALLRPGDLVARYGGEEFALLLPETPRHGAEHLAARALDAVAKAGIPHAASPTAACVTVSIGISSFDLAPEPAGKPDAALRIGPLGPRTAAELIACADQALYAAKRAGRAQARWQGAVEPDPAGAAGAHPRAAPHPQGEVPV